MRYLLQNNQCFTPSLMHVYLNQGRLHWFFQCLWLTGHVNVEISELDLLK